MRVNWGLIMLAGIVSAFAILMAVLIQMPFTSEAKDSEDAYYGYTIDEEYVAYDINLERDVRHVIVTVSNHGYANDMVGTYDFSYKVFHSRAGGAGFYYHHAPMNITQKQCENGSMCSFELTFDTTSVGELDVHSATYRYKQF